MGASIDPAGRVEAKSSAASGLAPLRYAPVIECAGRGRRAGSGRDKVAGSFRSRRTYGSWAAQRADARFTEWLREQSEPAWSEATHHRFTPSSRRYREDSRDRYPLCRQPQGAVPLSPTRFGLERRPPAFLGQPVTAVLSDRRDGGLYAALRLGHFGIKFHRSADGGETLLAERAGMSERRSSCPPQPFRPTQARSTPPRPST